MIKASQDLRHEHEAILFALKVLEEMIDRIKSDKVPIQDIINIIDFLKIFADKCHHGKEEGLLFPALEVAGIPKDNGPIGVMLIEHAQGRDYIKKMQESSANNTIQKDNFIKAANDYISLLRSHIDKENNVLFPTGDDKLSESKQKELLSAFEEFEENIIGKGKHEELHKMLDDFNSRYLK